MEVFDHDLFHMGGDEVYTQCWESNSNISEWIKKDKNYNYLNLWGWFQEEGGSS
jgi:N-acetyl-beta-hexosaminidase